MTIVSRYVPVASELEYINTYQGRNHSSGQIYYERILYKHQGASQMALYAPHLLNIKYSIETMRCDSQIFLYISLVDRP